MNEKTEYKSAPDLRKIFSKIYAVMLCVLCAVVSLAAAFICVLAFSKTSENTAQLFGYKIYVAEYDIEPAGIESGSLILVKNTDDDEFYTPEMLEKAVIIKNAGKVIKQESLAFALAFAVPFMLLFIIVLLFELRKKLIKNSKENDIIAFSVEEEFEEQTA